MVLGNCTGPGGDLARVASLAAGLPVDVPGLTVDRQCGSGLAAVDVAARAGAGRRRGACSPAGWSPRQAPSVWPGEPRPTSARRSHPAPLGDPDMGLRRRRARREGRGRRGSARTPTPPARTRWPWPPATPAASTPRWCRSADVRRDERPRTGLTVERLARLRPAFRPAAEGGTVTAGSSCGVNDGAAAVTVVDADTHRRLGVPGLRVLATATAGVDPNLPGPRPGPRGRAGAGPRRPPGRRPRRGRAQRGVRRAGAGLLRRARPSTRRGSASRAARWRSDTRGVRPVRCSSSGSSRSWSGPTAGRYGLAAIAVGGGQGVAMVVERCR